MSTLTSSSKPLVFWPRTGMLAGEGCVAGRCTLTLFTLFPKIKLNQLQAHYRLMARIICFNIYIYRI